MSNKVEAWGYFGVSLRYIDDQWPCWSWTWLRQKARLVIFCPTETKFLEWTVLKNGNFFSFLGKNCFPLLQKMLKWCTGHIHQCRDKFQLICVTCKLVKMVFKFDLTHDCRVAALQNNLSRLIEANNRHDEKGTVRQKFRVKIFCWLGVQSLELPAPVFVHFPSMQSTTDP